ncbi:LOW QUALITY PROTEIN: condensin-2 complex subunit D3-like, partial [Stegodyphus dumicola]|uniref:LOW QUALITY PROTEIN: condensin-2 complex subunit D3-like n=1 Tax=Stegodyphus dumicola TaxID=202533 RepID=UPI0015B33A4A
SYCFAGSSPVPRRITPTLKAHAFATLGKILLQDEKLAKEILPMIANELIISREGMIRNNIVMILIEMCKRYTCYADQYIQILSLCFKDKLYLVRCQTIALLVNLFQEDYIKWKGSLFVCILSAIIDKYKTIQELGRYCLCQLLQSKKKSIFSEHFVESIFVLNNYAPPDNEALAQTVTTLKQFALKGDKNSETRLLLYKFMLDNMFVAGRALLVNQLCEEILSSVAEAVYPLIDTTESMVKDCFMILNSKEIRFDENTIEEIKAITEDADEPDEEGAAKTELQTRRVIIIDPIIPVIISLKNCVMHAKSELISDLILFLRDLLRDYKTEISSILAADKMLERQVQIELKNEMMHMEKESKDTKKDAEKDMDQIPGPPRADQFSKMVKERTSYIMNSVLEDSRPEVNGEQLDGSVRLIPRIPVRKSSSRHSDTNKTNVQSSMPSCSSQREIPEMSDNEIQEMMMSSTPRVVLTALKIPEDIDLSKLSLIDTIGKEEMDVDSDSSN